MPRIAIVDDDRALLDLMTEILAERDWQVLAYDHADGITAEFARERPDAALLDIRLGGVQTGWEVVGTLLDNPITCEIPLILWSGDATGLDKRHCWLVEHGIAVLPKPFDIDAMFACLEDAMARGRRGVSSGITG